MSVHGNATLCPSANTVPIEYLYPPCLPCLSRWRTLNQKSSPTTNKCKEIRKYAFPDPCLLDFFLVLVDTTTSQNIRHFFNTLFLKYDNKLKFCFDIYKYHKFCTFYIKHIGTVLSPCLNDQIATLK